jgi:hypothetical protein
VTSARESAFGGRNCRGPRASLTGWSSGSGSAILVLIVRNCQTRPLTFSEKKQQFITAFEAGEVRTALAQAKSHAGAAKLLGLEEPNFRRLLRKLRAQGFPFEQGLNCALRKARVGPQKQCA